MFLSLINWTVDFKFLKLVDLKHLFILGLSAVLLTLIAANFTIKQFQLIVLKLNVFVSGFLMSTVLLFSLVYENISPTEIVKESLICLKPMVMSVLLYAVLSNFRVSIEKELTEEAKEDNSRQDSLQTLSRRETEVYELVMKGYSNSEIADQLYIAETTVKKHMQHILKKTDCKNRQILLKDFKDLP